MGAEGILVVIEGCDGAGKSTITPLAVAALRDRGHLVQEIHPKRPRLDREPGYITAHLDQLRELLWGETSSDRERNRLPDSHWVALSSAWFLAVDELVVRPALEQGGIVVLDSWYTKLETRFSMKSAALDRQAKDAYRSLTQPLMHVLLDVDPALAAARKTVFGYSECGHFDGLQGRTKANFVTYQSRVRAALMARATTEGWRVVDSDAPKGFVADQVATAIETVAKTALPAARREP